MKFSLKTDDFDFDLLTISLSGIDETSSNISNAMETSLLQEPLFLALADILHINNYSSRTWGGLSSNCTKLQPARSKSNKILEINVP